MVWHTFYIERERKPETAKAIARTMINIELWQERNMTGKVQTSAGTKQYGKLITTMFPTK